MTKHESSVNYERLIRDLAEMYPFPVEEVVISELVANSLDAGAGRISVDYDSDRRMLVVADDGKGMSGSEFSGYHDFAAGLKRRGNGIGFAGVGAKISFNIAERVMTETCSDSFRGGSDWRFEPGGKLVWEDREGVHLEGTGTRVEIHFRPEVEVSFENSFDLEAVLRRHYLPLLDPSFLDLYAALGIYPQGLLFAINGTEVTPKPIQSTYSLTHSHVFFPENRSGKYGYGLLGLAPSDYPLEAGVSGVLVCTRGKVIKSELFSQFPGPLGPRILGVVEIPPMVEFLTTTKNDFVRRGRYKEFEQFYDPVRSQFKEWLKEIGVQSLEIAASDEISKIERELRRLVDDVPELGEFLGFRARKEVLMENPAGSVTATASDGVTVTFPETEGSGSGEAGPLEPGDQPGTAIAAADAGSKRADPVGRKGRRGPKIAFAEAADRDELAWVEGSNIVINSGHPAYNKVQSSPATRMLHNLYSIAGAVQRFVSSEGNTPDLVFIDRMMKAWGKR